MPLPQLNAKIPEVIPAHPEEEEIIITPAAPEKIYDKYWVTQLSILSPAPDKEARIVASLVPCRDVGETKELIADDEGKVMIVVSDLFARMATDVDLATAFNSVLVELVKMGEEQGVIS